MPPWIFCVVEGRRKMSPKGLRPKDQSSVIDSLHVQKTVNQGGKGKGCQFALCNE